MKIDNRLLAWARPIRFALLTTVGLGLLAGIATVVQAHYLSATISRVFLGGAGPAEVQPLLAGLLLAGLARAVCIWGSETLAGRAAVQVKTEVRARLLTQIQALGPAYVRGERTGELVNTAVEGVEALDAYFSQYLPQLALAALVPAAIVLTVFPVDLVSSLVLLLTAPLVPLFMILIGNLADAVTRKQWAALSRLSAHFLDVLQGLTTLKLFNRSRQQIQTITMIGDRFRQTTLGVLRVAFLSALVLELIATLSTAVVAVEIGVRLLYAQGSAGAVHISFEQAFFVLVLAPEFYLPLRLLGQRFHAGVAGLSAAQRIFAVLETAPEPGANVAAPSGRVESRDDRFASRLATDRAASSGASVRCSALPRAAGQVSPPLLPPSAPLLSLRDVHYAYDAGRRPALRGVSFDIAAGQTVALVGPTGGGKSTVAQLLLRFIEPQQGEIRTRGVALGDVALDDWRNQIAWVPQLPYFFYGTVADNIRLARPAAGAEEVAWAARQAHADEFIRRLPTGYETLLGERGAQLSGGQAQRLALARAFLKDAPFMILDEATANLDPATEALVQEATGRLLARRTALIITHRLNTIAAADQIVVLRSGRIEEAGTHEELLTRGSYYKRLVGAAADTETVAGRTP